MKQKEAGKLYVVATPIGNLGDISKRALEILAQVDLIAAEDTRHSKILLNHYGITTKMAAYHKFNEETASRMLVDKLLEGQSIAIITDAGTPCISDPGATLINIARQNDIEVLAIPGPSSVIAALSVSGFYYNGFEFSGFFPRTSKEQKELITNIKNSQNEAFVMFESPNRLEDTLKTLLDGLGNLDILISNDLTKMFEKTIRTTLSDAISIIQNDPKSRLGEYVLILSKPKTEMKTDEEKPSLEAVLVDFVVKNKVSIRDAVISLSKDYNKNELYKASLRLKNDII